MRTIGLLLLLFAAGCASNSAVHMPSAQEFGVPSDLAKKFEAKENTGTVAVAPEVKPVEAPAPVVQKSKKSKKKVAGKPKLEPAKVEAVKAETWPNRWTMAPFFKVGERYLFDITYFGATAGNLELQLMPEKVVDERPTFHIRATANTSSVFSLFYRLHDVAESFVDTTGLFSHKFSLKLDESMQTRDVLELYDQRKHKAYYWSKLDSKKKGKIQDQFEIPMEPFSQDGMSAFFYIRTLPLEVGKVYFFPVVNNGKPRTVQITVVRKEMLSTKIGERPTIVVKPEVVLDGVLSTYGESFIWISDDPERILLKIDAKIKVGSVIAYLKEHGYDGKPDAVAP
ncbi:MAG: DUF3108 domain-containing protein [Bdellovibrionota bacterium]